MPKLMMSCLAYVKFFAAVLREASKNAQAVFPFGLSLMFNNTRIKNLRGETHVPGGLVITAEITGSPVAKPSEFGEDHRKIQRWFQTTSVEVEISFKVSNDLRVQDMNIQRSTLITKPLGTQAPNKTKRIRLFSPETPSHVNANGIPEPIGVSVRNLVNQCSEHTTLNSTENRLER